MYLARIECRCFSSLLSITALRLTASSRNFVRNRGIFFRSHKRINYSQKKNFLDRIALSSTESYFERFGPYIYIHAFSQIIIYLFFLTLIFHHFQSYSRITKRRFLSVFFFFFLIVLFYGFFFFCLSLRLCRKSFC